MDLKTLKRGVNLIASNSVSPINVEVKYDLIQHKLGQWGNGEFMNVVDKILDNCDYFPSIKEFNDIHNSIIASNSSGIPKWIKEAEKEGWKHE